MDIAKRINDICAAKDWSIHQLALECDISRSALYRIISHDVSPTFEQIEKICEGFNIAVSEFFNEDLTPNGDEVILLSNYRKLTGDSKKMVRYMIENMK